MEYSSWTDLFHQRKGRSNFTSTLNHLRHRAAPFLQRYARHGVPVVLNSRPWTLEQKDRAMTCGNHPSTRAFTEFMESEMTDMCSKGMFIALPYEQVRDLPELRISPLGCVPQRERQPRIINDYTYSGVNAATVKMAPEEAMQWGRTLQQILWFIHTADNRHGPVLMSKTDLSDGFYQLHLTPSGTLKLAVPLESPQGRPHVAIPTRLPMGWTESPPAFSAVTETIADLVNEKLEAGGAILPIHPLESLASSPVPLEEPGAIDRFRTQDTGPVRPPLAYVDVYVDDFIKLAQGWSNALRVRRNTYHTIDQVFRPNDDHDDGRKEPISQKKLSKGDDFWSVQKIILGWLIDSARQTITLPKHRQVCLSSLLTKMVKRKRSSVQEWQCLLGELRSMALALPGSNGCFSLLQHALGTGRHRIKITPAVRDQLHDFLWLADSVINRPTHLAEVVPTPPTYFGSVDAAKRGMGGVWFPPLQKPLPFAIQKPAQHRLQSPILWRARFDKTIQDLLVSQDNPQGTITNSDLELAGAVAHDDVLVHSIPDPTHITSCTFSDNTPAISWKSKGSNTTSGPAAYLLQTSALHCRHFRYNNELHHISGPANSMADDCSRLWRLLVAAAPPAARNALRADFELAQETVKAGVVPSRNKKATHAWGIWVAFCNSINVDPFLSKVADPVVILQTFGLRWRDGRIVLLVSQRFPSMGAKDPRLDSTGKQDFRLTRMYAAWKKVDLPPTRVEPVPMQILRRAAQLVGNSPRDQATIDCIWMASYFLLRPGEYANATGDAKHPFRLKDIELKVGSLHLFDVMSATTAQLSAATYVSLTFTTQKNGVKGEKMAHVTNGQPQACPVRAILRRASHLRAHSAPESTPLHMFFDPTGTKRSVSSTMITSLLKAAALSIPGHAGVNPDNIAARSLRSSGAMALLLGGIDPDRIRILGRWRSDAMFRYLHSHALPLIQQNSSIMFSGGHYSLVTRHRSHPPAPP